MRNILLIFSVLLFFVSCGEVKKADKEEEDIDIELLVEEEDVDTTSTARVKNGILDPTKGVLVVFKSNTDIIETERIIEDKGLKLDKKWITDKNSLNIGIIKVPANEKEEWLNKLIESGRFRDVKLYSEENLKKLLEDRKLLNKK